MKSSEKGYSLIELIFSISIIAMASGAAGGAVFQILHNTERNSDQMTVVRQVQNAGYWISSDARMAVSAATTDNLTSPDFLVFSWTKWEDDGDPIYYSATYFFADNTSGVGTLKRRYWTSTGANQTTTRIAQYIYYDPADAANTSNASYQNSILTVTITAIINQTRESKEYKIKHRPDF